MKATKFSLVILLIVSSSLIIIVATNGILNTNELPRDLKPLVSATPLLERKSSFLIMFADDLGWGDVSYNQPNDFYSTPNIDAMSRSPHAFRMDNFHSPASVCSPSRISIITSRHWVRDCVWGANVKFLHANIPFQPEFPFKGRHEMTLPRVAQNSGRITFLGGKWHISDLSELSHFGFDQYDASAGNLPTFDSTCFCLNDTTQCQSNKGHYPRSDALVKGRTYDCWIRRSPGLLPVESRNETSANRVAHAFYRFISSLQESEAFFAILAFNEPHIPFIASPSVRKLFLSDPLFLNFARQNASMVADYYGAVEALDHAVGLVRSWLKDMGRSQDTFVVFSSDNGPETLKFNDLSRSGYGSAGNFLGKKRSLLEGGHRVPGIIEFPQRIHANVQSSQLISMLDVTRTIFELMEDNSAATTKKDLDGEVISVFDSTWVRRGVLYFCLDSVWWLGTPKLCPEMAIMDTRFKLIVKLNESNLNIFAEEAQLFEYSISESLVLNKLDFHEEYARMVQAAREQVKDILAEGQHKCRHLTQKKA